MNPLTIVHTEASLGWGGQEIRIFTEMQAMRKRGHHVLLAAEPHSKIYQRAEKDSFDVFPFSARPLLFPWHILRLAFWLAKIKADVVNTHSSKDGWIGGIAARLAGVPCIIRSKHIDVDYPRKFSSRIAYGILPHHVLTTSRQIRQKISRELQVPESSITNMPTGIDPALFQKDSSAPLRDELALPAGAPLIGMISVIRSWKGHRFFLEAARSLLEKNPSAHFAIAGDGPGLAKLKKAILSQGLDQRVFCLGHRQDVPQLLKSLDVLVLPSIAHEGVPQIILQAQFSRCPVVATTIGGIPEVVKDGISGRLVPPSDGQALAVAIEASLVEKETTAKMVEQAYSHAMEENTLEIMCVRIEKIYRQILGT